MGKFIPNSDNDYGAWIVNFNRVALLNQAALDLSAADITKSETDANRFTNACEATTDAKATLRGAVLSKRSARRASEENVRGLARRIQANPNVSDALKASLGLPIHGALASAPTNPFVPIDLVATPAVDGINTLTWKTGGNKPYTQYIVEAIIGDATEWLMLGTTTKRKYLHTGQTPGVLVRYRVKAQRKDIESPYSNEAVVYASIPAHRR